MEIKIDININITRSWPIENMVEDIPASVSSG